MLDGEGKGEEESEVRFLRRRMTRFIRTVSLLRLLSVTEASAASIPW
jgi:hypothetical protein